jgi:Na+/phosphate symporter
LKNKLCVRNAESGVRPLISTLYFQALTLGKCFFFFGEWQDFGTILFFKGINRFAQDSFSALITVHASVAGVSEKLGGRRTVK